MRLGKRPSLNRITGPANGNLRFLTVVSLLSLSVLRTVHTFSLLCVRTHCTRWNMNDVNMVDLPNSIQSGKNECKDRSLLYLNSCIESTFALMQNVNPAMFFLFVEVGSHMTTNDGSNFNLTKMRS